MPAAPPTDQGAVAENELKLRTPSNDSASRRSSKPWEGCASGQVKRMVANATIRRWNMSFSFFCRDNLEEDAFARRSSSIPRGLFHSERPVWKTHQTGVCHEKTGAEYKRGELLVRVGCVEQDAVDRFKNRVAAQKRRPGNRGPRLSLLLVFHLRHQIIVFHHCSFL